eukprot:m.122480 g.122480  ORF g.122480 m.122480 type:complete len:113 (+) comp13733_c1_seq1:3459-3797(+)
MGGEAIVSLPLVRCCFAAQASFLAKKKMGVTVKQPWTQCSAVDEVHEQRSYSTPNEQGTLSGDRVWLCVCRAKERVKKQAANGQASQRFSKAGFNQTKIQIIKCFEIHRNKM